MTQFRQIFLLLAVNMALVSCDKPQIHKIDEREKPVPIVNITANYPRQAALNKIEGQVTIAFTVTESGAVKDPKIIASSPDKIFDQEALRAIVKYTFAPKRVNGKAIESNAVRTIEFKLLK